MFELLEFRVLYLQMLPELEKLQAHEGFGVQARILDGIAILLLVGW
ncbi:MAG: hypothetical protein RMY64_31375 [Nostoc sp. DedQUE08]|nr:hypothetical protein [Nostoc sp. DedQUE08]